MSEELIIAIIGAATTLLSIPISFLLGKRSERNKQLLIIRAEMLKPIQIWLSGAEKMQGILGDTVSSVALNSSGPTMYNLEDRRKAAQFMVEQTNIVMGIIQSNSLQTKSTKKLWGELSEIIIELDGLVKYKLTALDNEALERRSISPEFIARIGTLKQILDAKTQKAYSLIAQIKTFFT